jgi:hypothetical protein
MANLLEIETAIQQLPKQDIQKLVTWFHDYLQKNSLSDLDPWTQSLIGVIPSDSEVFVDSYVNYLEEKYR